jgi:hypothetical protein
VSIGINLATKQDAVVVDGLTFSRPTSGNTTLAVQLDTELAVGEYVEIVIFNSGGSPANMFGVTASEKGIQYQDARSLFYYGYNGSLEPGSLSYGASWTINDVIGLARIGQGTLRFYKNGVAQPDKDTSVQNFFPSYILASGNSLSFSGRFYLAANELQYLPTGFQPMGEKAVATLVHSAVLMSTLPASLTRGFRV